MFSSNGLNLPFTHDYYLNHLFHYCCILRRLENEMKIFYYKLWKLLVNSEVSGKFMQSIFFSCLVKEVLYRKECLKVVCLAKFSASLLTSNELSLKDFMGIDLELDSCFVINLHLWNIFTYIRACYKDSKVLNLLWLGILDSKFI